MVWLCHIWSRSLLGLVGSVWKYAEWSQLFGNFMPNFYIFEQWKCAKQTLLHAFGHDCRRTAGTASWSLYLPPGLQILRSAHTVYLCVLCGSQNKQRLFPVVHLLCSSLKHTWVLESLGGRRLRSDNAALIGYLVKWSLVPLQPSFVHGLLSFRLTSELAVFLSNNHHSLRKVKLWILFSCTIHNDSLLSRVCWHPVYCCSLASQLVP